MSQSLLNYLSKSVPFSASLMAAFVALPAFAQWQPTKAVEIVVPAGAGGASDQMVRTIQGIVLKHQLMKQPIIVTNKAGASGGEGLMDVKDAKADPHKLMVAHSAIYTLPISAGLPFSWRDLNPVALIAMDEFLLWVNSETPYKTPKEYLAAVKAAPSGTFKMGGTGSKREDHIITVALDKITGTKFTYIPYRGGGEAATQLVGKHTDSNVNNPSENIAQWRAGQVRALCVFSEKRMAYPEKVTKDQSWADIPTCRESGVDVVYQMLRGFFLPPGTSKDQVTFYADLLKKVTATPDWQDYLAKQALKEVYLTGPDYLKFLEGDEVFHNKLMNEAGFAHKK